jgi:hypothetical protein
MPDGVPVAVGILLVRHLGVPKRPERIRLEQEPVSPVVEGIEDDGEILVIEDPAIVPPHLVRDHPLGLGVPEACREIDVGVVEEHPDFGSLRLGHPLARLLLDKARDRGDVQIEALLESPVDLDRLLQPDGPERDASPLVAVHDLGLLGSRRAIDETIQLLPTESAALFRARRGGIRERQERQGRDRPPQGAIRHHRYQSDSSYQLTPARAGSLALEPARVNISEP